MARNLVFGILLSAATLLTGCGRQVTPNLVGIGPLGTLPGQMAFTYNVAAPFNFSSYQYWVIFDTTGDGATPSTQPINNNWAGYSDGIEVTGNGGSTSAQVFQFVKNPSQPKAKPGFVRIITTPQQMQYLLDDTGLGTDFTIIFNRSIFTNINNQAPLATNWTFNAFTTQANTQNQLVFLDSMGTGGPGQPEYNSPILNTLQCFDNLNTAYFTGQQLNQSAQIVSVELANNPTTGGCDIGDSIRSGSKSLVTVLPGIP